MRQFHQEKVKTASRADATTITQDYTLGEYWVPPKKAAAAAAAAAAKAAITDGEEGEGGEGEEPLSDDDFRGEMLEDPKTCLLYTSPSPRDKRQSRMPSSA